MRNWATGQSLWRVLSVWKSIRAGADKRAVDLGIEEKDKAKAPVAGAGRMERGRSKSG